MRILAIIPARSGSKSVKDKNIRLMAGKPMMAYSIEHALKSSLINRVIVSTDSEKYANIAKEYGAQVPFLRPQKYATDTATDFDVFSHVLSHLRNTEDYIPDIVIQLRPTYPIRNVVDIDNMIQILIANQELDSVRSISPAKEIPYKMWTKEADGKITPVVKGINECYNMPRQELPKAYYQNANIDVVRPSVIIEKKSMSGNNIHGYVMNQNFDIDTEDEFLAAASYLEILQGKRIFCFDIDGVIALFRGDLDYANTQPNQEIIDIVNKLYDYENKIILFTARGYMTGIDWKNTTKTQMDDWNVKYTELLMGKPAADYYIDDHTMTIHTLLNLF